MTKKTNSNFKGKSLKYKIAYIFVIIFIFALFVGSFGGLLYLGKSCSTNTVFAEEISGSTTETTNSVIISVNWQYQMERYQSDGTLVTDDEPLYLNQPLIIRQVMPGNILYLDYYTWSLGEVVLASRVINGNFNIDISMATTVGNLDMYFQCDNYESFTEDIAYIDIEYVYGTDEDIYLYIYDKVGNNITYVIRPFRVFTWELNNYTRLSIYQRYYLSETGDFSHIFQDYFNKGYEEGKAVGRIEGEQAGYANGYQDGVAGTEYTFHTLLDAVFYAPIKAFVSIFNFELLGVNVLSIASFILTVCIVVGVLKWVL